MISGTYGRQAKDAFAFSSFRLVGQRSSGEIGGGFSARAADVASLL
jgi:hypothetical protein